MEITNPMFAELVRLGSIDPDNIRMLSSRTRDREVPVLIDDASGVIFLQRAETSTEYYENEKSEDRIGDETLTALLDGSTVRTKPLADDQRRFDKVLTLTAGRSVCDFGCGYGGFLRLNRRHAGRLAGVELREHCRAHMRTAAPEIPVKKSILDFSEPFDLVTMFHVLEHIPEQIDVLTEIRQRLAPDGKLFVEVPHAGDFLIKRLGLEAFRAFTFWSEHLVLHTPASLAAVLQAAGFAEVEISGYQRYGYTNHLGWLRDGKPGGQEAFKDVEDPSFEAAYSDYLKGLGATDTLIAVARTGQATERGDRS